MSSRAAYLCFFLGFLFCVSTGPLSAEPPSHFRIGAVLPLTGPLSIQGIPMQNAMILADEAFDRDNALEILFEDDGFIPAQSVTAATKLMKQQAVDVLVVFGTNQGMAVVDITERAKQPFLSININRNVVRGRKYAVALMPSLEALTAENIREAKRRAYKRVAILSTLQDSCLLQRDIFSQSKIAEIVGTQDVAPSEREFREVATRFVNASPDAIFLSTLPPQGSLFAKRCRALGYRGEFFGGLQIANLSEYKASEHALENAWVVAGDDRNADEFYSAYRKKFGSEATAESAYAYDAIPLLLQGLKSGDVNHFLHTVQDFHGMGGRYSADQENGFSVGVTTKRFTEQGFEYLDRKK